MKFIATATATAFAATVITVTSLLAGCATAPAPSPKPEKLVFAVQSANPATTRAAWQPLVADMGKKMGVPMELLVESQTETVKALGSGKADIVWLSSSVAIDAAADSKGEAFALYFNVNGTNGYKSVVVTKKSSGIATLDEALTPGKYRYANLAQTSTSGYVLPQHFLFNPRKTTAEALFKTVTVGSHFSNLDLLWADKVDVIVNNTTDLGVFQGRTPGAKEQLVTLWESPLVPNDVLMFRSDTAASTKKMIKDFILSSYGKTEEEKALMKAASGILNFISADNKLLEPVSGFKFGTARNQIAADSKLGPEDKARKLADLEQRIERFKKSL